MLAQADALCLERRFEEAATIYQQLVTMAETRLGPNHPDAILVLQRLADSLYAMNLFRDCLPLYERLCSVARGMLGDQDPDVINLMFKIGKTQELIGSFVEARSTYQFAINTAMANLPPGHELTIQLQNRYTDVVQRIEENKEAAKAWKENTVTNPIITMGPDGKPLGPPAAPQPMQQMPPLPQMPPLQQIPPGVGIPQTSQLPPHLMASAPVETPYDTIPPTGVPFNPGQSMHPEGSPFADRGQPPSDLYNGGDPAHPPGSPFGNNNAPPAAQSYSAPPAMASSMPPPVMSSQPETAYNPWDAPSDVQPGASAGFPPPPQSSSPVPPPPSSMSVSQQMSNPYQQQMPPQPQQMGNPFEQQMPPQPQQMGNPFEQQMPPQPQQMGNPFEPQMPPQPQQMMPPLPQMMPPQPQQMMPPQQMAPPQGMMPPQQMAPPPFPPQPQSPPFPPSPQGLPPLPQPGFGAPNQSSSPSWDMQNAGVPGSIGSQLMNELENDSISSMPSSLQLPSMNNPTPGMAPNMMPPDGNGFGAQGMPPSGFPPSPQSSVGYPPGGAMTDPYRQPDYNQGPPSIQNQNVPPPAQGGLYTAGPEPMRTLDGVLPSPLHQAGLVKGGPLPVNDPFSETGRKNNPDPYLDHLAAKVADLKAQKAQVEEPPMAPTSKVQSSGWHDAISIPASERVPTQELNRRQGAPPVLFDESTEYGDGNQNRYEEFDERERSGPTAKVKSSRAAVSKSEGLVSNVRAFKEYLIPVVVILVIGIGGYFFFATTMSRPPSKVEAVVAPVTPGKTAAEKKTVYATADNTMRLAVGTRDCSLVDGKTLINVPCVLYDGGWDHAAMQIIDSVLERQIWFNQMPEGMVTENGTILFDTKAPDRLVMDQMNAMAVAANASYRVGANYPVKQAQINSQTFFYRNPFTGQSNFVKLQIVHEVNGNRQEIIDSMLNGALILGEQKFGRGDVRCYAMTDASGGTEKGLGFFVRGADRNGNLFRVSNTGQTVLLGYVEGKDVSNSHIQAVDNLTATTPLKPTKVWIAKGQQLPIFVIYHSLPIGMAIIAFLAFWRSLMVAPGQDPNNSLNRSFRIISYIAVGIGVITSIIQYTLWM